MELGALVYGHSDGLTKKAGMAALQKKRKPISSLVNFALIDQNTIQSQS